MKENEQKYLLTFELDSANEMIEIHCDNQGLVKLRSLIDFLISKQSNEHLHLMSDSWGGDELSSDKQGSVNELVNHVKIYKWI